MQSIMKMNFGQMPDIKRSRTMFEQSFGTKFTGNVGYLIPFFYEMAMPGDTFNLKTTIFARVATPVKPIMDNLKCSTFYLKVPLRLLWTNFPRFMGERSNNSEGAWDPANPVTGNEYVTPKLLYPTDGWVEHSLGDYFGYPINIPAANAGNIQTHAFFARAYNACYNDLFRDENLQDMVYKSTSDGPDQPSNYNLLRRGKRKDYITSCLPFPQRGPDVILPLGGNADVWGKVNDGVSEALRLSASVGSGGGYQRSLILNAAGNLSIGTPVDNVGQASNYSAADFNEGIGLVPYSDLYSSGLYADLEGSTGATINEFREALQMQRFYEIWGTGGHRYEEFLLSMWGVVSPDYRAQQPIYLGGSIHNVTINPVTQSSAGTEASPQGNMGAYSYINGQGGFRDSVTEHCVILGIMCVDADLTYQQNLEKMHSLDTLWDFPFPIFENLGEEPVYNREVLAVGAASDEQVFGYQERYACWRHRQSTIKGFFRSASSESLDVYHLSEDFGNTCPELGDDFIQSSPPLDRCIAVQESTGPQLLVDMFFDYKVVRNLAPRARTGRMVL